MATWLVYAVAAVVMLAVTVIAILIGLALRFVAGLLRELGDGGEKDYTQHEEDGPRTPA